MLRTCYIGWLDSGSNLGHVAEEGDDDDDDDDDSGRLT